MDLSTIGSVTVSVLGAIGLLITSVTGLLSVIQGMRLARQVTRVADRNAAISQSNTTAIGHVANQVTAVDAKVEAVAENTNGHMTSLIAAVAPVDPVLATAAAIKIVENAGRVADQLRDTANRAEHSPPPK